MGLSNTIANVAGFIAPIVTGAIIHENVEFASLSTVRQFWSETNFC